MTLLLTLSASPTPSPGLEAGLVAPAGSGYVEGRTADGYLDGPMTPTQWAGGDIRMLDLLRTDHFVSGYARSWVDSKNKKFVFEAAAAFRGKVDALSFLAYWQTSPTDTGYSHAIVASGIDGFVGGHFADPKKPDYWDEGVFVKGNDLYTVYCDAQTDSLGDTCATLAQAQFDASPQYTIPPSLWPENASQNLTPVSTGSSMVVPIAIFGGALLVGLAAIAVAIVMVVRRRGAAATPPVGAEAHAADAPQMSPDGRYWWDGQAWRDAESDVPTGAMRSADGFYWWDGTAWRLAPRPA